MVKGKRGQTIFFLLSIGIVFFILGLALTPGLTEAVSESTSTVELNCTNISSLSDQDRANCTSWDIMPFLFFGTILGLAGILISSIASR